MLEHNIFMILHFTDLEWIIWTVILRIPFIYLKVNILSTFLLQGGWELMLQLNFSLITKQKWPQTSAENWTPVSFPGPDAALHQFMTASYTLVWWGDDDVLVQKCSPKCLFFFSCSQRYLCFFKNESIFLKYFVLRLWLLHWSFLKRKPLCLFKTCGNIHYIVEM